MTHTDTASEAGKLLSAAIKSYTALPSCSAPAKSDERSVPGCARCHPAGHGAAEGARMLRGCTWKGKSSAVS